MALFTLPKPFFINEKLLRPNGSYIDQIERKRRVFELLNWPIMLTLLFILAETILIARGDYATEISLTQKLLNGYSKEYPSSEYTVLQLTIFINQITSIDDSNQQMKSSINIMVEWYDERLQWDTSAYNIEWVLINANSLWLPDLVILNSVSSNIFLSLDSKTLAYVYYSGVVAVIYSVPTLTTRCSMDVAKL